MAKMFLNPLLEGISGKVGKGMVAQLRWDITPIRGIQAGGLLRALGQHASYGQTLTNVRHSFTLVTSVWNSMTTAEQQSWVDQADVLSQANSVFYSGIDYFIAFTMSKYAGQYGANVYMTSLTTTSDWTWANRADFVWTA